MLYSTIFTAAAFLATAVSALENPFHTPIASTVIVAGKSFNITWGATTTAPVTLLLKKGLSTDLSTIATIASDIPNTGFYVWSVPATLVSGSDYALEITDAAKDVNYTPQFTISGVAASATSYSSSVSSAATTTSTVVSTHSTVKTSTVASVTVYASTRASNGTLTTSATLAPSASSNGTIIISTLRPTAGETTAQSAGTSTGLPRPTATVPSSAGNVKVAVGVLGGALAGVCAMLF